ncbi:hypothetical protein CBOM_06728 [Ceraceosorus bombacis]|uniref:Fe2OG dioxygenase domain-containing protein n=1 Tax=Ceraceosorus bombacis TaxID=401625 RepID=A0A0P1BSD3_9BASI|nr:hypothetical protein CBOM_06728 [Ceraceosorus bombacis]
MRDLRKFMEKITAGASDGVDSAKGSTRGASHSLTANDADLERALELSEQEARVSAMSEEEALEAALAASMEQEQRQGVKLRSGTPERYKRKHPEAIERSERADGTRRKVDEAVEDASRPLRFSDDAGASRHDDADAKAELKQESAGLAPLFGGSKSAVEVPIFSIGGAETSDSAMTTINKLNGSLDLLYCKGWIVPEARRRLFRWMLNELAWHRVVYTRPNSNITIRTPRLTTTFGRDDTGAPDSAYPIKPRPFPKPLAELKALLEHLTGTYFNTVIINLYLDGSDSISYHSDDEAFLGSLPTIASISLGATRDFFMRRKAPAGVDVPAARADQPSGTKGVGPAASRPTEKFALADGDLLIMRGRSQADYEHAIPKRKEAGPRINLTFRRVTNVKGTNNFQRYNRGGVAESRFINGKMIEASGGL